MKPPLPPLPPDHPLAGPLRALARADLPSLAPTDTVFDAARIMAARRLPCVPVLDERQQALGVVTEARLLAAVYGPGGPSQPIAAVMQAPLCVPLGLEAHAGFQRSLAEGGAPLLLVDEQQRVVGLVDEGEFRARLQLALQAGRHRVASLMTRVQQPLTRIDTLDRAIAQMHGGHQDAVVVTDGELPVGVLTARDVARLVADRVDARTVTLGAVMSHPVLSLPQDATIHEAAERMLAARTRHLVVVGEEGRVVGVLDEHELTRAMAVQVLDVGIEQDRVRQRALLDAIPDLVWLKDPDGAYVVCNPRFEQLFGAPEAEIRGKTDRDFVSPELAGSFRMQDLRAMAQGGPTINEEELTFAADGHVELMQTVKTPVRDRDGRLLGVLGIARDITALRRAEGEYRWLFAHNPAPMFLYAREDLGLLQVNDAFCSLYGYSTAETPGLSLLDLYLPEDRDTVRHGVRSLQGLVNVGQWRHVRRDGSIVHVVAQSHDTVHEGRACRLVVVTDITELQRARLRDRQHLALMERLARGDDLNELLGHLVRDHESLFPGSRCSVLLLGDHGAHLRLAAAPSLPEFYRQAIDGLAVGADMGCCGAAVFAGQRVVADALTTQPNWGSFSELAARAGLVACWSEPITGSGSAVLGSFAVYRRAPGVPDAEEQEHIQFAVQLAATAITQGGTTRALRDSRRRLDDILQAIPDLVWMKDLDGVYRSANAAFARMAGFPLERIVGARDEDLTTPERAALFRQQDAQVIATGQPLSVERWMMVRATGQHMLTELIKAPLLDDDRRVVGVLGVARDITLLKQGAQALAEQQRLIDTMFSQTTDAILLTDPESMRTVHFNDAACAGLGYSRQAFAALTPDDLQIDLDRDEVRDYVRRAMHGEEVRFDTRHRRADGGVQLAALTLRSLTVGGRLLLSAVWRDVTEERQREARVQRLNRSYAVLSAVNEAVVRLRDRQALFAEVCHITTTTGGFSLAWIGEIDPADERVRVFTHAGRSDGYVESLNLSLTTTDSTTGLVQSRLVALALEQGHGSVIHDVARSQLLPEMRERLIAHGQRSLAAFPILPAGGQRLVLLLYSTTADHFDEEHVALFDRLARDVAFALEFIAAEQAQVEARRFREQLIESVAGLFFAVDPEGRLVLWNRRVEEVTGQSREALATLRVGAFFDEDERCRMGDQLAVAFRSGEAQMQAELRGADGSLTPYLFVVRRLDMAHGPLVVGTGIDISDRVRTEQELAGYRTQLEGLVQQRTAELQTANDRLHREDRRLRAMLSLSQRASELDVQTLYQVALQDILTLTGSTLGCLRTARDDASDLRIEAWVGTDQPPPDTLPRLAASRREPCLVENDAAAPGNCVDGIEFLRGLCVPVVDGDRVRMVICTANKSTPYDESDVRELQLLAADLWAIVQRRRIEIALGEAKAAADAASQAKSAFLANMSHEIRTPMNAVIGFAHLLKRDPLTPRQRDHLGKIGDASEHLLQVINDILDFSKIEAHKITLESQDFALREGLDRVLTMQRDAALAKQLPLRLSVADDCPPVLRGDRLRLEQILLNLLSNAVKFTAQGHVEVRVQRLAQVQGFEWLRFEVTDTGIGMTDAQLDHVFEAFAQADASTTRRFGGTGLGLAICKRLVELIGGRIGAASRQGQGSTFWVELPFRQAEARLPSIAAAVAGEGSRARLKGRHVLLAEDNPINQEVASALLAALGVTVDVAASGEEVLARFDRDRHDLVLMDVQMPGMDGLQATEALRARPDGREVPIVAMTANAFAEDRAACLAAGMTDYLSKPVEPLTLEHCLLRWLRPAPDSTPHRDSAIVARPVDPDAVLRQRVQAVEGLDVAGPLARMRGAWPLYLRTLRLFVEHHRVDVSRLREPVLVADRVALRALVHSLAGAAATVGAVEVQQRAQQVQHGVETGPALADAVQALAEALERLVHEVQSAQDPGLEPNPPVPGPAGAEAVAAGRAALLALQPLVLVHDTAALPLGQRHREALRHVLGADADVLLKHLGDYNFPAARQLLASALRQTDADQPAGPRR